MIGFCTDSGAQLPPVLADRFGAVVVPITVELDGHEYLEGVDLAADEFYDRFRGGGHPAIRLVEPSPGQFALAYEQLAERGCQTILSIHSGRSPVATLNPARLAAHRSPVPIRVVDTGTTGVSIACSLWAAADAVAHGAVPDAATSAAEALGLGIDHVFTLSAPELIASPAAPVAVLTHLEGVLHPLGQAHAHHEAVALLAERVLARPGMVRVAIGLADRAGEPLVEALLRRFAGEAAVDEAVVYRIGPSAGGRTGSGSLDVTYFAAPAASDAVGSGPVSD